LSNTRLRADLISETIRVSANVKVVRHWASVYMFGDGRVISHAVAKAMIDCSDMDVVRLSTVLDTLRLRSINQTASRKHFYRMMAVMFSLGCILSSFDESWYRLGNVAKVAQELVWKLTNLPVSGYTNEQINKMVGNLFRVAIWGVISQVNAVYNYKPSPWLRPFALLLGTNNLPGSTQISRSGFMNGAPKDLGPQLGLFSSFVAGIDGKAARVQKTRNPNNINAPNPADQPVGAAPAAAPAPVRAAYELPVVDPNPLDTDNVNTEISPTLLQARCSAHTEKFEQSSSFNLAKRLYSRQDRKFKDPFGNSSTWAFIKLCGNI
jgi:hypothetical protein